MEDVFEMCRYFSTGGEIPVNKNDPKSKKIPLVRIYRWCFKFRPSHKGHLFNNFNIHIKGFKKENGTEVYWESSKIMEVRSQRIVLTKSTGYYLYTEMDTKLSLAEGFEPAFNEHFKNGFTNDWHKIIELFGNYITQNKLTVREINRQLMANSMARHMPKAMFFRRSMAVSKEQKLCTWIDKNDAWNEKPKRRYHWYDEEMCTPKKRKALAQRFEPINSSWSGKDVEKLFEAVTAINPCSENDWNKVMHLFGQDRPLEEVKAQAKQMLFDFGKKSGTDLVKKLQKLTPNGRLPKQGTLRRQALSDELCKILYFYKNQLEKDPEPIDFDSDDEFINDAMTNSSLDKSSTFNDESLNVQLGAVEHSLLNDSCRRLGTSENPIDIGDDFDIPNRSDSYVYQYQVRQLNPQFRRTQIEYDEEVQQMFVDDECEVLYVRPEARVKMEKTVASMEEILWD